MYLPSAGMSQTLLFGLPPGVDHDRRSSTSVQYSMTALSTGMSLCVTAPPNNEHALSCIGGQWEMGIGLAQSFVGPGVCSAR